MLAEYNGSCRKSPDVLKSIITSGKKTYGDISDPMEETAKFWHAPDIGDLEMLKATYISHTFSRHTHAGYVIGIIEHGVEAYEYRGQTHFAIPGDIVIINPDMVHTGHAGNEQGWSYRMFYPSIALIQGLAETMAGRRDDMPYFNHTVIKDPALFRQMRHLHQVLEQSASRLDRQTCFYDVMGRLLLKHAGHPPAVRPTGTEHHAVAKAVAYIDDTLSQNISLQELSAHVGLSPFYFSRLFSRYTGLPPHAYRKQRRIQKAKQMLSYRVPIAQVAVETGFSDQSHLTRHFKQVVGVTPGHYAGS
jgi:AraC-like DNA-binding protein